MQTKLILSGLKRVLSSILVRHKEEKAEQTEEFIVVPDREPDWKLEDTSLSSHWIYYAWFDEMVIVFDQRPFCCTVLYLTFDSKDDLIAAKYLVNGLEWFRVPEACKKAYSDWLADKELLG